MEGKFARQFLLSFETMVSFYFFVNLFNVLSLYFLVFAFPLRKIVISTMTMWFGNILSESYERYNFIMKAFNNWVSFTENLPLFLSVLERQESLQPWRREDWLWQSRNQIALLLGDTLLKDLSWNEERQHNKILGHWPKRQLIVRTYRWRKIPSFVAEP